VPLCSENGGIWRALRNRNMSTHTRAWHGAAHWRAARKDIRCRRIAGV